MTEPPSSPPPDDPLLAAYYEGRFETPKRFDLQAALMPFWLAWRKHPVMQVGLVLVFWFLLLVIWLNVTHHPLWALLVTAIVMGVIVGAGAPSLELRRANRCRELVLAEGLSGEAAAATMRQKARPSWPLWVVMAGLGCWSGFYLVMAMSAAGHSHTQFYEVGMKSGLRNLAEAQEAYFRDSGTYYRGPVDSILPYQGEGIVITIGEATRTGWNASASTPHTTGSCYIWVGDATRTIRRSPEAVPRCEDIEER